MEMLDGLGRGLQALITIGIVIGILFGLLHLVLWFVLKQIEAAGGLPVRVIKVEEPKKENQKVATRE